MVGAGLKPLLGEGCSVFERLPLSARSLPSPFGVELGLAPGSAFTGAGVSGGASFHSVHPVLASGAEGGRGPGALLPTPRPVGSPGRIRTIDPAVNSRLLYH
jgi:hypothetical protein